MRLRHEFVVFHLSAEGIDALGGIFPAVVSSRSVRGYVVGEDQLGFWVLGKPETVDRESLHRVPPTEGWLPVFLLKRQYFSTATFETDAESLLGSPQIDIEFG